MRTVPLAIPCTAFSIIRALLTFFGSRCTLVHNIGLVPPMLDQISLSGTSGALRKRRPGSRTRAIQGTHQLHLRPNTTTPSPRWGLATPSQNLHRKLRPNGTRYKGIDSLWELTSSLANDTIVDPRGTPVPKNLLGNQKIEHGGKTTTDRHIKAL